MQKSSGPVQPDLRVHESAAMEVRHVSEGETEEVEEFSGFDYFASNVRANEKTYTVSTVAITSNKIKR